ncbi:MAG TPA: tRNA (uridine(34)/cytosine(34)/5-carboxymethylaminomethyluridine(34)-2'-O)-methyltransferase TrmL [Gammaproteobacteria bacterium]|nr:tRNA (uridine(34)/cytosine(34)/5-carboxymethylaminomethyluridine(34)-2'-O)-methyltransferase TrmL [Gammaproteobacteria bacterium]
MHVVLYQPEIPPNTGNIIRICANTGASLHLIRPLGFAWDDKRLRRAGLDYHDFTAVALYGSLQECEQHLSAQRWFAMTTKGSRNFAEISFRPDDVLLYGPETRGLPDDVLARWPTERKLRIPMQAPTRSINLANSVAITLYEAWRQRGYDGVL